MNSTIHTGSQTSGHSGCPRRPDFLERPGFSLKAVCGPSICDPYLHWIFELASSSASFSFLKIENLTKINDLRWMTLIICHQYHNVRPLLSLLIPLLKYLMKTLVAHAYICLLPICFIKHSMDCMWKKFSLGVGLSLNRSPLSSLSICSTWSTKSMLSMVHIFLNWFDYAMYSKVITWQGILFIVIFNVFF